MIKVLLADDNRLILERFTNMIDWKAQGFELVASAIDGKNAWMEFQAHKPELVITDIQMPKMTGIELAEHITETAPGTVILFLTSYEEFSYVKSALELGVYGYLLKHETKKDKLIARLQEIKTEIKKRKLHTKYTAEAPLRSLIRDWNNDQVSEEALYEYEISLPDKYDMLLLLQDHIHPVLGDLFGRKTTPVDEKSMLQSCYECIPHLAAIVRLSDHQYLALVKSSGNVSELAYDIKKELSQQFQTSFSILIVADRSPILICGEKFNQSREAIRQKRFFPPSSVAHADYLHRPKSSQGMPPDKLDRLIKEGQFDAVIRRMDQSFSQAIEERDAGLFDDLVRQFASLLLSYHHKVVDFQTGAAFTAYDGTATDSWYDAYSIYQWIKYKLVDLIRALTRAATDQHSDIVQQVIEYVNTHYDNADLSIDLIADHMRMNPDRLNTKFKKETGETIWKFIIKIRMDKAKELLNRGNDKVTDICNLTGYKNISYFSKVFKETYGMTPLAYRRSEHET